MNKNSAKHRSMPTVVKTTAVSVAVHAALLVLVLQGGSRLMNPSGERAIHLELARGPADSAASAAASRTDSTAPSEKSRHALQNPAVQPMDANASTANAEILATEELAAMEESIAESAATAESEPSAGASSNASAADVQSATDAMAEQGWMQVQILDWLDQHKTYPRAARREGIEGTVQVKFALDAKGKLLSSSLVHSSGHRVLDRAAMDLLQRAVPYPVDLSRFGLDRLEIELPIDYRLDSLVRG